MYEQLKNLDDVRINFSAAGMHVINIILAFVMFGVALGIRLEMFKRVLQHPKSFILGACSQAIALPAITFLLVILLNRWITPMVAMGMILVAACPGGNISNFMSHFSKANTELAISLTALSTAISTFITPFNFAFWGGLYVNFVNRHASAALQELHIDTFQMFETVFILLGIPLILGMLTAKYLPKIANVLKKPLQYFSLVFFLAMIVLAFGNNFDLFIKYIFFVFIIVLIHNGAGLGTGYTLASLFKLPEIDRRTLTIETGIHNSGLGLALLFNPKIFPPTLAIGGMLFVTAWWGIWHIVSGMSLSLYWARKKPK
ncbi:MAG: bile acid:sodium symporter family protein [Paludibacter sp.]|nr:bile acid:sodium symporter family protein [Paludibacter sp.]